MSKLERKAAISHFPDWIARIGNPMSADGRGHVTSRVLRHGVVSTLVVSLFAASSAVAVPVVSAQDQVPFRATFSDQFVVIACPVLCVTATGIGPAIHLGRASEVAHGTLDPATFDPTTGCAPDTSTATLTAANGDQVTLSTTGVFCQTSTTAFHESGTYQITGGTGRFSSASGSGTYTSIGTFSGASGTVIKAYDGTLSSPRGNR
jgi:hypothetical protein